MAFCLLHLEKASSVNLAPIINKVSPSGHASQMLLRFAEAHLSFYFCSFDWDEMGSTAPADARTDSVETSVTSSVSDAISLYFLRGS